MKEKKVVLKEIRSWIIVIVTALGLSFLINSQVFASVQVQYSSMENTLFEDQRLFIDEITYKFTNPNNGDIITFFESEEKGSIIDDFARLMDQIVQSVDQKSNVDEHERLVKRVIGVEGDVIDIRDGYVYRNGEKLDEPYVKGTTEAKGMKLPVVVGKGKLFVLGDNRVVSVDSRELGLISIKQVEGKVIFRVYPFDRMGKPK